MIVTFLIYQLKTLLVIISCLHLQDVLSQTKTTSEGKPATKQSLTKHMTDLELLKNLHSSKAEMLEQQLASTK